MSLVVGDPAPVFYARSTTNARYAFDSVAGRNIVLTFVQRSQNKQKFLQELADCPLFDDEFACLFIVTEDPSDETVGSLPLRIPGVRAFFDDGGVISDMYRLSKTNETPQSFIISPRLQILAVVSADMEHHAQEVISILEKSPAVETLPQILTHAPILIIPNVFESELCHELITGYNVHGGTVSGFVRDVGGKTIDVHDETHKVRRDWNIELGSTDLISKLKEKFSNRVIPEIAKSYQFNVTRMERYIVSCYSAQEGGHFRAHRDNTTRGTAHRRFAVSLNLNAEDYDGGELRFPEFGMQSYKPPTGGACVFSCSLLHEATKVTKGYRYAFLPFLYDEAARKIREKNFKYIQMKNPL